jgi:hypothetical protein
MPPRIKENIDMEDNRMDIGKVKQVDLSRRQIRNTVTMA